MARDEPRTPLWRGLTLLQELRAANVPVAAASDNVRDWWHPYGDYDLLQVWREAVAMGHLDTAPSEGELGGSGHRRRRGRDGRGRRRHRGGRARGPGAVSRREEVQRAAREASSGPSGGSEWKSDGASLPDFSELDDLVDDRAAVVDTSQDILRGATKKE